MFRYDPLANALYVSFRQIQPGESKRTPRLDDDRIIDMTEDGEVLGVEFLDVSHVLNLDGVPNAEAIRDGLLRMREIALDKSRPEAAAS